MTVVTNTVRPRRHILLAGLNPPAAIYSGGGITYEELLRGFLAAGWSVSALYLEPRRGPEADLAYEKTKQALTLRGVQGLYRVQLPSQEHIAERKITIFKRFALAIKRRVTYTPELRRPWQAAGPQVQGIVDSIKPDICFLYSIDAIDAFMDVNGVRKIGGIGVLPYKLYEARLRLAALLNPIASLRDRIDARITRWQVTRSLREALSSTDAIVAFAANEASDCRHLSPETPVAYFPNMVTDEGYNVPTNSRSNAGRYRVALVGHLRGTATQSGLYYFATKIIPELRRANALGKIEFDIIGKFDPPPWLPGLLAGIDVSFRGFIEDYGREISNADVILVPIPDDVGNRTRIVTAWAAGCCVVTHASSVSGMPELVNGVNALIGANGSEIADLIIRACNDRSLNKKLREAARVTYDKCFKPDVSFQKVERFVLSHLTSDRIASKDAVSAN